MAIVRILIPLTVADETTAREVVRGLETQFPEALIRAMYENGVDTSANREAAQAAKLDGMLTVADDPEVLAAVEAAKTRMIEAAKSAKTV